MFTISRRLTALEALHQQREHEQWSPIMRQLTDDELDAIISGTEKANGNGACLEDSTWIAAHLTENEQGAIRHFVELAEKAGLVWQG
jgi:hypothetical protein